MRRLVTIGLTLALVIGLAGVGLLRKHRADQRAHSRSECLASQQRRATLGALTSDAAPLALVIGDSYAEGVGASRPDHAWPLIVGRTLNMHLDVRAEAGAGFTSKGVCGDVSLTDLARGIPAATVTVVEGGINDQRTDPAVLELTVTNLLRGLHGRVLLIGPTAPPSQNQRSLAAVDSALRSAAAAAGAEYVSVFTLLSRADYAPDLLHPDDSGHQRIASSVIAAVRSD